MQEHTGATHIQASAPPLWRGMSALLLRWIPRFSLDFWDPSFLLGSAQQCRIKTLLSLFTPFRWKKKRFMCWAYTMVTFSHPPCFVFIFLSHSHEEFLSIKSSVPFLGFSSYTGFVPKKIFSISEIFSFFFFFFKYICLFLQVHEPEISFLPFPFLLRFLPLPKLPGLSSLFLPEGIPCIYLCMRSLCFPLVSWSIQH